MLWKLNTNYKWKFKSKTEILFLYSTGEHTIRIVAPTSSEDHSSDDPAQRMYGFNSLLNATLLYFIVKHNYILLHC